MDLTLKISKSFIPKLNQREYFSNYFRYEEGAKLRLCADEFRKLKKYMDHFKHLLYLKMFDDVYTAIKLNKNYNPNYELEDTKQIIALLLIIQTEDRIKYLSSRKITINSSDQKKLGCLLKLFKNANPEIFQLTTLLREKRSLTLTRNVMNYHFSENMQDHILTLAVKLDYELIWKLANELNIESHDQ